MMYKKLRFFEGLTVWEKIVHQFEIFPGGKHKHDDYIDTIALFATNMLGTKMLQMPITPVQKPLGNLADMMLQAEANNSYILGKQAQEAAELRVTDGFSDFNGGFDAY
jgi:hypothetical protein